AWATNNRLVLGQVKVDKKSNEIKAIPELIKVLSLRGCIVTIDAIGCQKEIVKLIAGQQADACYYPKKEPKLFI
ncbi:MAG TPA: ISAs1 family transposase, partial [Cyanobacteria bacterium UBA11049]|nr:ISAs1 family transposase [Cyanobacteria bacterium UBA11049]